ncbi:hypothetical protein LSH36_161g04037, partial [Paralvinella palmiformis]
FDDNHYNKIIIMLSIDTARGMMEPTQPTSPRAITTTTDRVTMPLLDSTTTIPDSGVDFDANTRTCYYLAQVEPPLVTRGVSGVTHYRKVDCTRPLRCFVSSAEVRSPLDMAITNLRTPQSQCNGVCYTRETIGATTNTVDRGCMTASVPVTLGCQLSEDLLTITCFCDTMRCNALSVVAMATQLLHMPLDDDLSDHSGTSNSAAVPDNYTPPDFQCLDKAINCSALFTGNQCIRVTSLTNTDFGVVGQDFRFSPEATFSVYFKRVTTSGPGMEGGIFGNSDDPNVKPTWQIASKQFNNYTTAGLTSEDTQLASLMDYDFVRADNDKWHLMVMTYEGLFDYTRRMFPKLSLYLDGKAVDGNSMLEQGKLNTLIISVYIHLKQSEKGKLELAPYLLLLVVSLARTSLVTLMR